MFDSRALVLGLAIVASACTSTGSPSTPIEATEGPGSISIPNQGGNMEGHTPTGFAGSGTGLIVGDNLNSGFPEGQGVQTYLTFALPSDLAVGSARIISNVLETRGSPFEDLGTLLVEPVEYSTFGPELYDVTAVGAPVSCVRTEPDNVECDVTSSVQVAADQGDGNVQFRLRFERPADSDGQPDLALFYLADSNTNEPGLFTLLVNMGG